MLKRPRFFIFFLWSSLIGSLAGCETFGDFIPDQTLDASSGPHAIRSFYPDTKPGSLDDLSQRNPQPREVMIAGSSRDTRESMEARVPSDTSGGFVLDFDGVDIRDVAKTVLGDQLGANYVIDPAVKGTITLHTAKPLAREAILPALAEAFKIVGIALVQQKSGFQLVPLSAAAQHGGFATPDMAAQAGFQIRVVPLRWVLVSDIQRALEPLVPSGTLIPGDPNAGFAVLSGTASDLDRAEKAIALFDVDWLRKQSFGLFPLRYSSAKEVANDLESVVGKQGPLGGTVRVTPIDHLNAIFVVSNNFARITQMRAWIERFDRGKDTLTSKIFIYQVQNGSARDLANVLSKVFGASADKSKSSPSDVSSPSDGSAPADAGNHGLASAGPTASQFGTLAQAMSTGGSAPGAFIPTAASGDTGTGDTSGNSNGLRITADEANNSLIIVTTPKLYSRIEAALVQLDLAPLQVLIEATVAEVDITDNFQYGVQTSIERGALSVLSSNVAASALAPATGGLSIALNKGNIAATLNLLSTFTKTKVISSPKLLVVNNKSASIEVGDQVPVATSSAVSTQSTGAPIVNTIQMVDTGIILHVTPRVNSNGQIMMDLDQSVSSSIPTVSSNIDSPTIQQRRVNTTIQIDDGQTVIIGGLISDTRSRNRTGVPVLKDVPYVGALFGSTVDNTNRTELMVLLTPKVIRNGRDADAATEELRAKLPMMRGMGGLLPTFKAQ